MRACSLPSPHTISTTGIAAPVLTSSPSLPVAGRRSPVAGLFVFLPFVFVFLAYRYTTMINVYANAVLVNPDAVLLLLDEMVASGGVRWC